MDRKALKRKELGEAMADHLLANGLENFTLRALATATGTSDRMLLHYFSDKGDLLETTLRLVLERMMAQLDALRPPQTDPRALIAFLASLIGHAGIRPFTNLWLDLSVAAIRQGDPFASVAREIAQGFLDWIRASLAASDDSEEAAGYVLAVIEGLVLLDAVGRQDQVARALTWTQQH